MKTGKYDENRLLHLLLDMGEMLLASGAEINRVEDTLQRIGRAYGAAKMNVFVITSSIVITMEKTDGELLTHCRKAQNQKHDGNSMWAAFWLREVLPCFLEEHLRMESWPPW